MTGAPRKIIMLSVCGIGLWLFFAVLTPRLLALCPAWQKYDAVQEQYGLDSGALYYTNVPVTQEAESSLREAVRRGMLERRKALEKANGHGKN